MPFSEDQQPQPRRVRNHRRNNKPDLNIDTFDANAYSYSPDYEDNELSTPLSPPPPSHLAFPKPPDIPYKSSQRSLNSPSSSSAAGAAGTYDRRPPPLSLSRGRPAAADDDYYDDDYDRDSPRLHFKLSSQGYRAGQEERDARTRPGTTDPNRGRDLGGGHHDDRADGPDDNQTFFDAFSDTFSDADVMSNQGNDSPLRRRHSRTPPPSALQHRDLRDSSLRDSHDLSLSPRNVTRDSLLGNMLLSLDQFNHMSQVNNMQTSGETRTMSGFAGPHPSYRYEDPAAAGPRAGTAGGGGGSRTMTSTTNSKARNTIHAGAVAGGRGGHGYSYSSDYEGADDDLSRVSTNMSRGRRSNSLSANPGGLRDIATNQQRPVPGGSSLGSRVLHSRGGRGSKSSSTNSVDAAGYAHVLGSQKWAQSIGVPKRSSSLEPARRRSYGTQPPDQQQLHSSRPTTTQHPQKHLQQQQQQGQQPSWHIELPNSFFDHASSNLDYDYSYDLDDAAPTPTVPVGPRRLATMPSMPSIARHEPMGEPLSPVRSVNLRLERKRSNKSSRSTSTAKHHPSSSSRRDAARERDHEPVPPLPLPGTAPGTVADLLEDSAPAPHVGYEKAKEPVHASPAAAPTSTVAQHKEKQPGFFRRMFGGGSKNSLVAALDQSASLPSSATSLAPAIGSPAASAKIMSSNHASSSQQSPTTANAAFSEANKAATSTPSSRQTSSSHGIQKKPSGFFRRRKKSVSVNNVEPPPLPPTLPPSIIPSAELLPPPQKRLEVMTPKPEPSPVTSLRKAMDPFLKASESSAPSSGRTSPRDDQAQSVYHSAVEEFPPDRQLRSFSPDYEPDPRATIRSVPSDSRPRVDRSPTAPGAQRPGTPTRHVSKPLYDYERSSSFLHDNSESDGSPQQVRKQASQSAMASRSRSPIPVGRMTLAPIQTDLPLSSPSSYATIKDKKLDRLTQDSMASEKSDRPGSLTLPIEGFKTEPEPEPELKTRASAASIPDLKIEGADLNATTNLPKAEHPLDEPHFIVGDPTQDDKAKAQKIFDGSEDFIPKEKAASWMGEEGPIRQRTLRAYMDLYDFTNKNIVTSLRDVCNRLILRAETQQVDRILVTFSKRWCDCNPHHGFKSVDVIHTICYSIMLLNTDLHMADIESKMTRSQFIKNTMTTVRQAVAESIPNAYDRPSILPGKGSTLDDRRQSLENTNINERTSFRNSFIKLPGRAGSALGDAPTELDDCGPLVKSPFEGSLKAWESQMEVVLKDIYASIRDERLPLYGAEPVQELPSAGGLSVMGMLKRSPSVLSKAPSENPSARGRVGPESIRAGNGRWSSKSRSRPRGFGSAGFASSRTSFDDGQSLWSPVDSVATWSRASLGRTHTSMSMDSFGSRFPRGDYQQSIGFANALSQAIIREDPRSSVPSLVSDDLKTTQLLDDESLELAGPPWVKEGIVIHKHHLDGVDKKAKDRNWTEVFAVIQKGNISIFSFTPNKSMGRRSRNAPKKGAVVGGGNWQENATTLGTWSLRLTLASALPPPGYSKQRPHVWALSLPTGAVHLFHVGTPEICNEFVTTANYWSARLSTHPLIGGVSNMEFGWSDAIINNALVSAINETTGPAGRQRSSSNAAARSSMHSRGSSFRSVGSFDFGSSNPRAGGVAASNKLPGDIVNIAEWTPPTQSMRPSNASEKDQLDALLNYVKSIEEELQQHNALRSPMLLAFTPRGSNAQKAMANWERKSSYLLREIVKFRTYVDILQLADTRRTEIYREREVARRAARGSLDVDRLSSDMGEGVGSYEFGGEDGAEYERGRRVSRGGYEEEEEEEDGDTTLRA